MKVKNKLTVLENGFGRFDPCFDEATAPTCPLLSVGGCVTKCAKSFPNPFQYVSKNSKPSKAVLQAIRTSHLSTRAKERDRASMSTTGGELFCVFFWRDRAFRPLLCLCCPPFRIFLEMSRFEPKELPYQAGFCLDENSLSELYEDSKDFISTDVDGILYT